jgi:hypothetical protein
MPRRPTRGPGPGRLGLGDLHLRRVRGPRNRAECAEPDMRLAQAGPTDRLACAGGWRPGPRRETDQAVAGYRRTAVAAPRVPAFADLPATLAARSWRPIVAQRRLRSAGAGGDGLRRAGAITPGCRCRRSAATPWPHRAGSEDARDLGALSRRRAAGSRRPGPDWPGPGVRWIPAPRSTRGPGPGGVG